MTLRQARILSSETDNTIKQEQQTNVNIKISKPNQERPSTVPLYPNVQPLNSNVNFTQPSQSMDMSETGQTSFIPMNQENSPYQYQPQTNNNFQVRGISDLGNNIEELDKKNKFLEMIIEMYETNPLKINSYVVCESKLLMNMIKLLTECYKVEYSPKMHGGILPMLGSLGNIEKIIIYISFMIVISVFLKKYIQI